MRASFAEEKERNIYSRFSNPNTSEFTDKICRMEGAEEGVAFASGMGAVFSTFATFLKAGDHILSARAVLAQPIACLPNISPSGKLKPLIFL